MPPAKIAKSCETGTPGVCEDSTDKALLAGLRLNLLETVRYLTHEHRNDSALETLGLLQLNAALAGNIPVWSRDRP
jgi:hypothetical protein